MKFPLLETESFLFINRFLFKAEPSRPRQCQECLPLLNAVSGKGESPMRNQNSNPAPSISGKNPKPRNF